METNPNTCGQDGEEDRMLNSTSCPNNPPTPCVRKTPEESDLTPRVSNSFVHVPEHQLTARVIIGRCKWYSLLISILLSGFLNIVLMTTGVWYGVQPWYHVTKYHRPRPFNLDHQREFMHHTGVTDLVSLPCNSRASLTELFPPMIMEYANISETQRRQPYCYLPHSEHLTHLLRIVSLFFFSFICSLSVYCDRMGYRFRWLCIVFQRGNTVKSASKPLQHMEASTAQSIAQRTDVMICGGDITTKVLSFCKHHNESVIVL